MKFLLRNGHGIRIFRSHISGRHLRLASSFNGKKNVILMGSPGSGKTTIGKLLAPRLNMAAFDIDNHHLESYWNCSVADKLKQVGPDAFIEEEGKATLCLTPPSNMVISLTGSNPMVPDAMNFIKQLGIIVFLDANNTDIAERMAKMKVNRIVGMEKGLNMLELLQFRQQFYEGNYDIRVICESGETPESITAKVEKEIQKYNSRTGFISTRASTSHRDKLMNFSDVVLQGLANDGGLFVPRTEIPKFTLKQWERLIPLTYAERALRILEQWIHPVDIHPSGLMNMLSKTYNPIAFSSDKIVPVRHLCDNQFVSELFRGPTASFKDAALQLMPHFFEHSLNRHISEGKINNDTRFLILVATSGDTGSAVLYGYKDLASLERGSKVQIMVLYPEEGVSTIQKTQMTTVSGHGINVLGVKSDFDFCQSSIKSIFNDQDLAKELKDSYNMKLSAANSINWGRLLPQVVYHASSYLDLVQNGSINLGDPVDLCIPTGNFGNILAAFYAKQMGLPFRRLICASNVNNVITDFFNTGTYDLTNRALHITTSPAIDILKSSNLERYLYHKSGGNGESINTWYNNLSADGKFTVPNEIQNVLREDICADWSTENDCLEKIRTTFNETGYLLDPHTAVAKVVGDRHNSGDCPMIISSTAHYGKFAQDVLKAINPGQTDVTEDPQQLFSELQKRTNRPEMHGMLQEAIAKEIVHKGRCPATVKDIVDQMEQFIVDTRKSERTNL